MPRDVLRAAPVVFGSAVIVTVPLPLSPLMERWIQETELDALQ